MALTLYSYFRSSAAYRVRIALNLKRIAHEFEYVSLLKGNQNGEAYKQINPTGLVPSLKLDDGTVLMQSGAILEWLEEAHPAVPLLPEDAVARGQYRGLCHLVACDIHPINNLRILKYLEAELNVEPGQRNEWYLHWLRQGFEPLESMIEGKPYAMGDSPSLVDVYLVPQVYNALRFKLEMDAYPKITKVYESCLKLDAFAAAAPENQADSTL